MLIYCLILLLSLLIIIPTIFNYLNRDGVHQYIFEDESKSNYILVTEVIKTNKIILRTEKIIPKEDVIKLEDVVNNQFKMGQTKYKEYI